MRIDLNELCNSLSDERIIELVTELGSDQYVNKSDCILFKTICHNEDAESASLKLYYYKKNKQFHCYTECGETFSIIGLFEKRYTLLGIKYNFYKDIVLKLAKGLHFNSADSSFYFPYKSNYDDYQNSVPNINFTLYNPTILECFSNIKPICWIEEGIGENAMDIYNIRYSISQNKIIIPHYDYDGNLIGVRGRALNPDDLILGKYMPVQIENRLYAHQLMFNLYGLNLVKDNIKKTETAIVAEGEKSCLLYSTMFGQENNICVAACGSTFHKYQLDLLIKAGAKRVLIAFDKEGKNWEEQNRYYNKLKKICDKFHLYCQMGFIFDNKNLLQLKDSPFDRGKEVFIQLYKEAIWVK